MNDKLKKWIEAEIEQLQQTIFQLKDYSHPSVRDIFRAKSAQEAALQSVLKKDTEIAEEVCQWTLDDLDILLYQTECGNGFMFTDMNIGEHIASGFVCCPYCGKRIKEMQHEQNR